MPISEVDPTINMLPSASARAVYWAAIAPAGVNADFRKRLHAVTSDILRQPEMVSNLLKQGLQPTYRTPEEFAAFIKSDMERWAAVVKSANITLEP